MDYGILIAALKVKPYLTDLEKDILDTWNEIQKVPFDRVSAQWQVTQNALKYPELLAVIIAVYFSTQGTVDIRDNLEKQLMVLLVKEGCQLSQQAETDVEGITGKQ